MMYNTHVPGMHDRWKDKIRLWNFGGSGKATGINTSYKVSKVCCGVRSAKKRIRRADSARERRVQQVLMILLPQDIIHEARVSLSLPQLQPIVSTVAFAAYYINRHVHNIASHSFVSFTYVPGMICTRQQPARAELFRSGAFFALSLMPRSPIYLCIWHTAVHSMSLCSKVDQYFGCTIYCCKAVPYNAPRRHAGS